jgi:peptidoglycan/LPS O-acetylase OafA/YrhL
MELLFITLGGAILGLVARYSLPHRENHGVALVPSIGAAVAAVVWVGLTWAGLPWDGGWIWVISLLVTALVVAVADPVIGIYRERADIARFVALRAPSATN